MFAITSRAAVAAVIMALAPIGAARAQNAESFYKGKTISVYIGFSAGGT
jgi:hypothetical protein